MKRTGIALVFASVIRAAAASQSVVPPDQFAPGRRIYEARCARCHGIAGDGRGRYAAELDTPPADFTRGVFKFRSTPSGSLPTDDDLMRVLERGLRGTAMLPWPGLSRTEKQAVIAYVKTFSEWFEEVEQAEPVAIPSPSASSEELVRRGRVLYNQAGCAKCHGPEGGGDGLRAAELTDDVGRPIWPTDFTRGLLKTGADVSGVYRTIRTGLDGTPMPSYGEAYDAQQLWALSYYVRSLGPGWPDWGRGMTGMMGMMGMRGIMMSGFATPDERRGMHIEMMGMGGMGMGRMGRSP